MYKYVLYVVIISLNLLGLQSRSSNNSITYNVWKKCDDDQYTRPDVFNIRGESSYQAVPNVLVIRFGIEVLRKNAMDAYKDATNIFQKTVSDVQQSNKDVQIVSTGLSIQAQYEWDQQLQQNKQIGYKVSNTMVIKSKVSSTMGKLIDIAIKNGVNRVISVDFELDPEIKKQDQALHIQSALQDALQRAKKILALVNQEIIGIKYINLETPVYLQESRMKMAPMAAGIAYDAPTQIYAGKQTQSTSVNVGFFIRAKKQV